MSIHEYSPADRDEARLIAWRAWGDNPDWNKDTQFEFAFNAGWDARARATKEAHSAGRIQG